MTRLLKDVASGELPMAVAFAQEGRDDPTGSGTPYATYHTESGSAKVLDDADVKDED